MNDPTVQMINQLQHQPPPPHQPPLSAPPQQMMMNPSQQQMMMNQAPPTMPPQQRGYGMWVPPPPQMAQSSMKFMNPNMKPPLGGVGFGGKQGLNVLGPRNNWKGKGKRVKDGRRKDGLNMALASGSSGGIGGGGYQPPKLNELQQQNRVKAKRFFSKKYNPRYHSNYSGNNSGGRNMGNFAPRNTTSFLIRAKKSGGIAELVSPCPVTPAVLPTPMFSPSREVLMDTAKEEWGVDGYGSMKGLIRLRSPGREDEGEDDDDEGESSESDVEDHVEVERRLDHDLSRFEMIYPNSGGGMDYNNVLENRVDDQDTHIAQLEEENLILKERLFLMERELGDLRRRLRYIERHNHGRGEDIHEDMLENESDSETESHGESRSMGFNHEEFVEENTEGHRDVKMGEELEGDIKVSKGNDENVTKKDNQASESMDEEGTTAKGLENAAVGSLGMSDNDAMPRERGVSHCNDENVTEKFDKTSELMNEMVGKDVPIMDNTDIENGREEQKMVKELGSAADVGSDTSSVLGESKNDADNDAVPGEE